MMTKQAIGVKDLRVTFDKYAKRVQSGESFIVYRKSQPLFRIVPLDEHWEEVIDFTALKKGGVNIKELLKRL